MLQPPMIFHQQHQHPTSFIESHPSSSLQHHNHHSSPLPLLPSPSVQHSHSPSSPQRANRVSSSEIETGVWTSTEIPSNVTFGPYDGEFTLGNGMKDHRATPYMLEVKFVDGRLISGPDAHPTRWMRFVSPARKDHEHNLEADCSACDGEQTSQVVFRTTRSILKGEELLVWYSPSLAEKEGVPISVNRFKGKDRFACSRCCSNFRYPNTLKAHMRFQCYTRDCATTVRHLNGHHVIGEGPSNTCSAFHRVQSSPVSNATDSLHVSSDSCPLVAENTKPNSELGRMDEHARRSSESISRSSSTSPNSDFSRVSSTKIGSGNGSAFRPTGKVVNIEKSPSKTQYKEKEGFRVVRKDSITMGNSMGTPISPSVDSKPRLDLETNGERKGNPGVAFSMDKVLSMPRVANPHTPGAALAYLQVQKALEKNYGLPTYDPAVSHAGELPVAIRSLHRGPLRLDAYAGYPYRFFSPPGFPVARLPPVLPMQRHSEAYNGLTYKLPYTGLMKYPQPEPTVAPPTLLTPPPEMDLNKYATLERNLTSQASRTYTIGDPQFAYTQNLNGKSKRGHLCIYCGKLYSRKYGLKIHLRTHTGYKPLKCKVCLRPFGDPSNLNKHIRLHAEGDTPYRCDYCGKVLVRRRDLDRHIRSRHPSECDKKSEEIAAAKENEDEQAEDLTISVDDDTIDCVNEDDMGRGDDDVRQN